MKSPIFRLFTIAPFFLSATVVFASPNKSLDVCSGQTFSTHVFSAKGDGLRQLDEAATKIRNEFTSMKFGGFEIVGIMDSDYLGLLYPHPPKAPEILIYKDSSRACAEKIAETIKSIWPDAKPTFAEGFQQRERRSIEIWWPVSSNLIARSQSVAQAP